MLQNSHFHFIIEKLNFSAHKTLLAFAGAVNSFVHYCAVSVHLRAAVAIILATQHRHGASFRIVLLSSAHRSSKIQRITFRVGVYVERTVYPDSRSKWSGIFRSWLTKNEQNLHKFHAKKKKQPKKLPSLYIPISRRCSNSEQFLPNSGGAWYYSIITNTTSRRSSWLFASSWAIIRILF